MKPSEFYEKYWLVNGKLPPKLSDKEKEFLDNAAKQNMKGVQFFRKRRRSLTIDVEYLNSQIAKLPDHLKNQKNE